MKVKPAKQKVMGNKRQKEERKNVLLNLIGFVALAIPLIWAAVAIYNYEKEEVEMKEAYEASLPDVAELIEHDKVCMATDAFMHGEMQTVVPGLNEPYYACSQHCISHLQSNVAERYAVDPVSKKKITKAKAYIFLHPDKSGKVCYFESKENHVTFIKSFTN